MLRLDELKLFNGTVTRFALLEPKTAPARPLKPYEQHALKEGQRVVIEQAWRALSLRAAGRGIGVGR